MYARLAAVDRFSFNQIASSDFIRNSMAKEPGFKSHNHPSTIRSKVLEFYDEAKLAMQGNLKSKVSKGSRFAVSFDEYTGRNRRYMTVNVHEGPKVWYNLGMIRVWADQTAETLLRLVTSRLEDFGITLERHVVALVTDGASMENFKSSNLSR